jgi:hypothetical protein
VAVSKRLRYEILRRDNHQCRYCGATAPDAKLVVDHVTPTALGGTDTPDNLVTACEPCNSGKTSMPADASIVADVAQDAARWAIAWKQAAQQQGDESKQKAKTASRVKARLTRVGNEIYGRPPAIPGDAAASIIRWLELGLPVERINELADYTISRRNIPLDGKWRYFAGCCWGAIRDLEARTRRLLGSTADEHPQEDVGDLDEDDLTHIRAAALFSRGWGDSQIGPSVFRELYLSIADAIWEGHSEEAITSAAEWAGVMHDPDVMLLLGDELDQAIPGDRMADADRAVDAWRETRRRAADAEISEEELRRVCGATLAAFKRYGDPERIREAAALAGWFEDPNITHYLPRWSPRASALAARHGL